MVNGQGQLKQQVATGSLEVSLLFDLQDNQTIDEYIIGSLDRLDLANLLQTIAPPAQLLWKLYRGCSM